MKKITKSNYPAYILDFYERTLDQEAEKELFLFLDRHPELKEEFDAFEDIRLKPESVSFRQKQGLKREESFSDDTIIAFMEGDLSPASARIFEQELASSPALRKNLELFRDTKPVADTSVVFPGRHRLKRSGLIRTLYISTSVAAALALFTIGYLVWKAPVPGPLKAFAFTPGTTAPEPLEKPVDRAPEKKSRYTSKNPGAASTRLASRGLLAKGQTLPIHLQNVREPRFEISGVKMPSAPVVHQEPVTYKEEAFASIPEILKNKVKKTIDNIAVKAPALARIAEVKDKSIWDYASAGLNGFAKITGANIGYEKNTDSSGTRYSRLVAGVFEFSNTSTSK